MPIDMWDLITSVTEKCIGNAQSCDDNWSNNVYCESQAFKHANQKFFWGKGCLVRCFVTFLLQCAMKPLQRQRAVNVLVKCKCFRSKQLDNNGLVLIIKSNLEKSNRSKMIVFILKICWSFIMVRNGVWLRTRLLNSLKFTWPLPSWSTESNLAFQNIK